MNRIGFFHQYRNIGFPNRWLTFGLYWSES
jgi:hypothetical protein